MKLIRIDRFVLVLFMRMNGFLAVILEFRGVLIAVRVILWIQQSVLLLKKVRRLFANTMSVMGEGSDATSSGYGRASVDELKVMVRLHAPLNKINVDCHKFIKSILRNHILIHPLKAREHLH